MHQGDGSPSVQRRAREGKSHLSRRRITQEPSRPMGSRVGPAVITKDTPERSLGHSNSASAETIVCIWHSAFAHNIARQMSCVGLQN